MKCTICGKEFGEGATCQNCGVDRVTGLGNYSGYSAPSTASSNASTPQSVNSHQNVTVEPKIIKVDSIVCYSCGEIIPADSKFCPHCSKELWVNCPSCGKSYSSQYPACHYCGTNRADYYERERKKKEQERLRELKIKEEERKRKERERIELENARKRHEEWLQSPEGQAETKKQQEIRKKKQQEKKGREKAQEIRSKIEKDKKESILLLLGALLGLGLPAYVFFQLIPYLGIIAVVIVLALFVFAIYLIYYYYYLNGSTEKEIQKWKEEHPNDIATPYL